MTMVALFWTNTCNNDEESTHQPPLYQGRKLRWKERHTHMFNTRINVLLVVSDGKNTTPHLNHTCEEFMVYRNFTHRVHNAHSTS